MKNIIFRPSRENEIKTGIDIFLEAMGREKDSEAGQRFRKFALSLVKKELSQFHVIEYKKRLIGNGALIFQEPVVWIASLGILPEFQGNGFGKELLKNLIKKAKSLGFDSIHLYATKKGEFLYRKIGFQSEYSAYVHAISEPLKTEINSEIYTADIFPDWIWEYDKNIVGYNRRNYLESQLYDNSRVIFCKNRGYGLLNGEFIGPVISDNVDIAIDIVLKSIELGAKKIIIPKHFNLSPYLFKRLKLKEIEGTRNSRMTLGKPIHNNLRKSYAIRSFGAG